MCAHKVPIRRFSHKTLGQLVSVRGVSTKVPDSKRTAPSLTPAERARIARLKRAQRAELGVDPEQQARAAAQARSEAAAQRRAERAAKAAAVRAAKTQAAQEKAEREAAEKARLAQERAAAERAANEAAEQARLEQEQLDAELAERDAAEKARAAEARAKREKAEQERLAAQRVADAEHAAAQQPTAETPQAQAIESAAAEAITVQPAADAQEEDPHGRERVRRQFVRDAVQPAADAPTAVKISGLVKEFADGRGVHGIDLEIPAGCFYGIVGPNGAGKSTVISMLAGLQKPDAGSIEIVGHELAKKPREAKAVMGVLPDRLRTFDRLTGRQLLRYVGQLRGLKGADIDNRTRELARAFDLESALGRVIADYSSGMTKKLLLAAALLHAPKVLVLDEPFEAVDPASAEVILAILRAYVEAGGTVVLSTHGMDLIERVCARVAVINHGHVLAQGDVDELRGDQSLESKFVELIDYSGDGEGLEWLYASSN